MIGGFCLTLEQNCRFREISAALFSVYKIKINIRVSKDLKPSGKKRKKKDVKKNQFPEGLLRCCSVFHPRRQKLFAFTFSFFYHSFVCEVFYWLCSVSMNQCEWHKGVVEWRQTWIHAAVGFESICNISSCISTCSRIVALCSVTLKTVCFLQVCWSQVGVDTLLPLFQKLSFIKSAAVRLLSNWVSFLYVLANRASSAPKKGVQQVVMTITALN